jgi:tRNA-specific 2-thiouridylase
VVDIDVPARRVVVGNETDLYVESSVAGTLSWPHETDELFVLENEVLVQGSAHGERSAARIEKIGDQACIKWARPHRRIAPGQTVVFYDATDTVVLGGGVIIS